LDFPALPLLWLLSAGRVLSGPVAAPPLLQPAAPVEQTIAAGQSQEVAFTAEAGQFLRIAVEQRGIDLVVGLADPSGSQLTEVNNPGDTKVPETISLVADVAGTYRLTMTGLASGAASGSFLARIDEARAALPADRRRVAAERAEAAADRRFDQRTAESLAQARQGYSAALDLWRQLADGGKEGEMLYRLGVVERLLGESRQALASLGQALAIQRQTGDRRAQAATLNQTGLAHWELSETDQALAALEEALALWRTLGEPALAARVLNNLGVLHRSTGRLRQAAEAYRQALEVFQQTADQTREATALNNLGEVYRTLGEPLAALPLHERALALAHATGERAAEAEALNNLGLLQSQLGNAQQALERFAAAEAIYRELGDRARQAIALNNLSGQYADLGEEERALELLLQALPLQRQTGNRRGEAATLSNLGSRYSALGRPEEATRAFEQALEIQREVKDGAGEAATLASLGSHYGASQPAKALELLGRALALLAEQGDRAGEARALYRSGLAQSALGRTKEAFASFEAALGRFRAIADPNGEAAALQEMARRELAGGDPVAARARLESALALVESLRSRVAGDRLRSSYFSSLREAYDLYVEVLMELHRRDPAAGYAARAFEAAERGRARSLLDLLREARVEIRRGADPGLLEDERRLRIALNAKAERLARTLAGNHTPEQEADARREVDAAAAAYELAESRLRSALPAYGALVRPEPATLPAVQALLDSRTLLLEYALGEHRSFLWALTPTSLATFELPDRTTIEAMAREAHARLSTLDPGQGAHRRAVLARLGRTLLGPVAEALQGKRLAVVAGGALQYIPFAALTLPSGEPVVARHEVVELPSAAVLGELRKKAASRSPSPGALAVLADPVFARDDPRVGSRGRTPPSTADLPREADLARAVGDAQAGSFPRLPWTRREAEAAAAQAGGRPVLLALGFQATLETATGPDLARYRLVHFATHGFLDSRHPELSGLVLSLVDENGRPRPGFLRLTDIYNLDLGAELVVLSGCRTALGREIRGEGLLGLTRGFLYAGSSRVIASLWPVRDRATAELMQRFYRALFRDGLDPAAALHAAQRSMWRDPNWRDPYFWAPFVVQGDWSAAAVKFPLATRHSLRRGEAQSWGVSWHSTTRGGARAGGPG